MKRPSQSGRVPFSPTARRSSGFTLVEMLVATALTMVLMAVVVTIFGRIGQTVSDSRSVVEATDRLRAAQIRLQKDLDGATATMLPLGSKNETGYFEVIEGPVGFGLLIDPSQIAINEEDGNKPDFTVGDFDDVLIFTTHSGGASFSGLYNGNTIESDFAEVAWFVRGGNLYRRVMLIAPNTVPQGTPFFATNDISVQWGSGSPVPNTLADLARRENRYAHRNEWPHHSYWGLWGMPTLSDCTSDNWSIGEPVEKPAAGSIDFWNYWRIPPEQRSISGAEGSRANEDVILTNVIGFDVKVYDIQAMTYVDLGGQDAVTFSDGNNDDDERSAEFFSGLARYYDTWTLSYENDGMDKYGNPAPDQASDGFDNNGVGGIDDASERETAPPYPAPLRGIRVEIRMFEPASRQIRVVTVIGEFLPK